MILCERYICTILIRAKTSLCSYAIVICEESSDDRDVLVCSIVLDREVWKRWLIIAYNSNMAKKAAIKAIKEACDGKEKSNTSISFYKDTILS